MPEQLPFDKLFTNRQLLALSVYSDLVSEAREIITQDSKSSDYANSIATYLSIAVDRSANYWSSLTFWGGSFIVQTFGRQALPMAWDFSEGNPFSSSTGNWLGAIEWITRTLETSVPALGYGEVKQHDATHNITQVKEPLISTDPPYYDNIGYADLSDFFYVWLRKALKNIYPELFSTVLTPKSSELVAAPHRFNGETNKAEEFFENGLRGAFGNINKASSTKYPVTVYYAFKQAEETDSRGRASTGWETMLEGLLANKFQITGTWPIRTERDQGLKTGTNVLASSIVLVCRRRHESERVVTRRDFVAELKKEVPLALIQLQRGYIAPVDLAQAAIGPGMAVFSRYDRVLEADGSPMRVRTTLALINQALDEFLAEQEGEFDADTRWALAWYEQYGYNEGPFGVAETLSKAKNTSVGGLELAGVLVARAGKVRLLSRTELTEDWDPSQDKRPTTWEAVQYLIRALDTHGEQGAALLLSRLGGLGETARDLAYRLYTICERKGWAQDALGYNMLVVAWPRLKEMAMSTRPPEQGRLL